MSYVNEAELWANKKQSVFDEINNSGLPLVPFGKSPADTGEFLDQIKVEIPFMCDNDKEKQGSRQWGLDIVSADKLLELSKPYNVLILVPFEHEIIPQLEALKKPPENIYRLDFYFEEEKPGEFFDNNEQKIKAIFNNLADDLSKATFEAVLKYRVNRDKNYLEEIALNRADQYFPEILDDKPFLTKGEIFADAGAFVGDTVEKFCQVTHNNYKTIYAFEPGRLNFEKLKRIASNHHNVFCYNIAVGDFKGTVFIDEDSSNTKVTREGEEVKIDKLDDILAGVPITYLKMDVEGAECAALLGAEKLIKQYKPKLAICAYHSDADMLNVPELILKLRPDYKLFFRHYTKAIPETVCYAI